MSSSAPPRHDSTYPMGCGASSRPRREAGRGGNFERRTMADISRRAGVSVGAFYHYFRSKDDILAEIFRRADEYFLTQVVGDLDQRTIPEQIVASFAHYAKFNVASGVGMTQQLFNPKVKLFIQEG